MLDFLFLSNGPFSTQLVDDFFQLAMILPITFIIADKTFSTGSKIIYQENPSKVRFSMSFSLSSLRNSSSISFSFSPAG